MRRIAYFIVCCFATTVLLLSSCRTPQKAYENGNYDEAIDRAVDRLRREKIKEKDVVTLVEAFNYINRREADRLGQIRLNNNNAEDWETLYDLAARINRRQETVRPLLSLNDDKFYGRLSDLYFTEGVAATMAEAREGAANHLYSRAMAKLDLAKSSQNRRLAREAYDEFKAIGKYATNYKDSRALSEEAYIMGINHVFVKVENDSRTYLPSSFERSLEAIFVRDLNEKWVKYHTYKDQNLRYDYTIVARINQIDISPEGERRDHHIEEAKVEDGFDYIRDERGNIRKDSLGRDLKTPRFVWVRADVFEIRQMKEARIYATMEYYDDRSRELVLSRPMEAMTVFQNLAVRFEGDRRALTRETCARLGGNPVPFPTDSDLLMTLADDLKSRARRIIRDNDHIVAR
jgi:hypothetical protein